MPWSCARLSLNGHCHPKPNPLRAGTRGKQGGVAVGREKRASASPGSRTGSDADLTRDVGEKSTSGDS